MIENLSLERSLSFYTDMRKFGDLQSKKMANQESEFTESSEDFSLRSSPQNCSSVKMSTETLKDDIPIPPLLSAIKNKDLSTVNSLLEQGVSPHVKDEFDATALHYAVASGDHRLLSLFLKHGVDMYAKCNWNDYYVKIDQRLVLHNSDNECWKYRGTAYELAIAKNDLESLNLFIQNSLHLDTHWYAQRELEEWPPGLCDPPAFESPGYLVLEWGKLDCLKLFCSQPMFSLPNDDRIWEALTGKPNAIRNNWLSWREEKKALDKGKGQCFGWLLDQDLYHPSEEILKYELDKAYEYFPSIIKEIDQRQLNIYSQSSSSNCSSLTGSSLISFSPSPFEDPIDYLTLEREADADWARRDNGWKDVYFFRQIVGQYSRAADKAIELSQFQDAVRLMEKEALVLMEELSIPRHAIDILRKAWILCKQIGDLEKMESLLPKLHTLTDLEIATCRADLSGSTEDDSLSRSSSESSSLMALDSINLIGALLLKAEILEILDLSFDAKAFYEEAGQLCLTFDEEEITFSHLDAALIAGLCFEKSDKTLDRALAAYERTLGKKEQLWIHMQEMGEKTGEWYSAILFAPVCRELSFAAIKCGKIDVFAEIISRQVKQFVSFMQSIPARRVKGAREIQAWGEYLQASVKVNQTLLGIDSLSEIETALQKIINSEKEPSLQRKKHIEEVEADLLSLYTSSKETPVQEIIRRFEGQRLLAP